MGDKRCQNHMCFTYTNSTLIAVRLYGMMSTTMTNGNIHVDYRMRFLKKELLRIWEHECTRSSKASSVPHTSRVSTQVQAHVPFTPRLVHPHPPTVAPHCQEMMALLHTHPL
eukprot:1445480-Pyramimonas_sp.AAC.1